MRHTLTERQKAILDAIRSYWLANSFSPSFRDLMGLLGIKSTNGIKVQLASIAQKGWITFQPDLTRSIVIIGESYAELHKQLEGRL